MSLAQFHPAVQRWFQQTFTAPTTVQAQAWSAIRAGAHTLIAAPTGSGKTLAAFLKAIDDLVVDSTRGYLDDAVQVVYVSPLKALSNDVERNLQAPLAGITEQLLQMGLSATEIRAQVRTGDTPIPERSAMRKRPPHILVTTPESLYLLLTSASGRAMLATTRSIIIDEIHAVANTKRGAHLALSLARLDALCAQPPQRIGLSATQKPIEAVAQFLVGTGDCTIVDSGHVRARDLQLVLPDAPLEAVMPNELWQNVYDKLAQLIDAHHTTLVFANTRRMVERVARQLTERMGDAVVAAHHGSLSKETRFAAEQRLKAGQLRVLVATASLELGIDIGDVDLVCQLGSPRSISTLLQRVGRANHAVDGIPRGRLFPLSRDELMECTALLAAVRSGDLDRLIMPIAPLDVLAQQLVAELANRDWHEDQLYALVCRAWNYRDLSRAQFDTVLSMLSDGFATRRGRQSAYVHRDAIHGQLRARKGARLTAITCGGAIPDVADYQVILEPQGTFIGTLNEDFAIESTAGDIFQLGNASYRILRVESGRVRVEDAKGLPPTLPFWLGEAPARTAELSSAVSWLRAELDARLPNLTLTRTNESSTAVANATELDAARDWLLHEQHLSAPAALQLVDYLGAAKAMLGALPSQQQLILERFFDESGGMQLVLHVPFGARMNRALGLALRKRFCRSFNFELQAAATEDAVILSLGETHSFDLAEVAHYLHSHSVRDILVQAMLDSPLFTTRWRWVTSIALAVPRFRGGKRTPAPLQRMAAEDLVAVVFPQQLACLENIQGDREIPDHPLVNQAIHDCLHEAMDIEALEQFLRGIEAGEIRVLARDLPTPSPLAAEILTAKPYAFLDDAPLEERRTQAVVSRRWLDPHTAAEFGQLDANAIATVRQQAWPEVASADELHDALMSMGLCLASEASAWQRDFEALCAQGRATSLSHEGCVYWLAAERTPMIAALYATEALATPTFTPAIVLPPALQQTWQRDTALVELLRGRLQVSGPITSTALAAQWQQPLADIDMALLQLESEGFVMRGQFTPGSTALEWCERRLLARVHRYTVQKLRAEIEPVSSADFMRFLLQWQGVVRQPKAKGSEALLGLLTQLEGVQIPASAWESDILPARMQDYEPAWLDSLCLSGRITWLRLVPSDSAAPVRSTPVVLVPRQQVSAWQQWLGVHDDTRATLSHAAGALRDYLQQHGASFFSDMQRGSGLLAAQAEEGLAELVAGGWVSADSFSGLRALILPMERKRKLAARGLRIAQHGLQDAGRWSLRRTAEAAPDTPDVSALALILLRRYGVLFRKLLVHESTQLPPWHVLLRALRQLEAQGVIRGGRFVDGVVGEQFALPEAVGSLRALRQRAGDDQFVSLSAADPLNLSGVVIPGPRIPALASNRLLLRNGELVGSLIGGASQWHVALNAVDTWTAHNALLHKRMPSNWQQPYQPH